MKEQKEKKSYMAPSAELLEVKVEGGFAGSGIDSSLEDVTNNGGEIGHLFS